MENKQKESKKQAVRTGSNNQESKNNPKSKTDKQTRENAQKCRHTVQDFAISECENQVYI